MSLSLFTTTEPWWADAECRDGTGQFNRLFFAGDLQSVGRPTKERSRPEDELEAKEICSRCPVAAQCLEGALARREKFGIWGGYDFGKARDRRAVGLGRPRMQHAV